MTLREKYRQYIAQISPDPPVLTPVKSNGIYLIDEDGKKYIDLISGISVSSYGHNHPKIINAIKEQADRYLHTMVFGEHIQSPQVMLAEKLSQHLGSHLNSTFLVNSGSEAAEAAIKLARRATGRTTIFSCKGAYHGNTTGAAALSGAEWHTSSFRPLLPGVKHLNYNSHQELSLIDKETAGVFVEIVQSETGYIPAEKKWLKLLAERCKETEALLIVDEVQTGLGRTGRFCAFQHFDLQPDIVLLAKALGAGLPLGALTASSELMDQFSFDPMLGHITTFGGHPLSCAAGLAGINILKDEDLISGVVKKEKIIDRELGTLEGVKLTGSGLLKALHINHKKRTRNIISTCKEQGVLIDWFLYNEGAIRIAPPLTISESELSQALEIIKQEV